MSLEEIIETIPEIPAIKAEVKKWIKQSRERRCIQILVTGRTGAGMSTLVNGLIGKPKPVAKEGHFLTRETTTVTSYKMNTEEGLEIRVWDSPGLEAGTEDEEAYLAEMKEKCSDVDIAIYCINSCTDPELKQGQKDFAAIKNLTTTFGPEWWDHAMFVLTFGNLLESQLEVRVKDEDKRAEIFEEQIQSWIQEIHIALFEAGVAKEVANNVPVEVAGHVAKPDLPKRKYWFSRLWFALTYRAKLHSQPIFIEQNVHRMKKTEEVKPEDLEKPNHEQPIVLDKDTIIAATTTFAVKIFAAVAPIAASTGATAGAAGGPAGIVLGAVVGVGLGGTAAAIAGVIFYYWKMREK